MSNFNKANNLKPANPEEVVNFLNRNAEKQAALANKLVSQNANPEVVNTVIKNANNTLKAADNLENAQEAVKAGINRASMNISKNTNNNGKQAANAVKNAVVSNVMNSTIGVPGGVVIANAANAEAKKIPAGMNGNEAALRIINRTVTEQNKLELKEMNKVTRMNNNNSTILQKITNNNNNTNAIMNNARKQAVNNAREVRGYNSMMNKVLAPATRMAAKNNSNRMITTTGNIRRVTNNNKRGLTNMGVNRVRVTNNNVGNVKTGKQVFSQGALKNVYANKRGQYTVSTGNNGNLKNYLFQGSLV
jgi:hypothetical protein